jgi:hypothetical protein
MIKFSIENIIEKNINEKRHNEINSTDNDFSILKANFIKSSNSEKSTGRNSSIFMGNEAKRSEFSSNYEYNYTEKNNELPKTSLLSSNSETLPTSRYSKSIEGESFNLPHLMNKLENLEDVNSTNNNNLPEHLKLLPKSNEAFFNFAAFQNFQIFHYQLLVSNARLQNSSNQIIANDDLRIKMSNLLANSFHYNKLDNEKKKNNSTENFMSKKSTESNEEKRFSDDQSIYDFHEKIQQTKKPNNFGSNFQYPIFFSNNYSSFTSNSINLLQQSKTKQDSLQILNAYSDKSKLSSNKRDDLVDLSQDVTNNHSITNQSYTKSQFSKSKDLCIAKKVKKNKSNRTENYDSLKREPNSIIKRKKSSVNDSDLSDAKYLRSHQDRSFKCSKSDIDQSEKSIGLETIDGSEKSRRIKQENENILINPSNKIKNYPCSECGKV